MSFDSSNAADGVGLVTLKEYFVFSSDSPNVTRARSLVSADLRRGLCSASSKKPMIAQSTIAPANGDVVYNRSCDVEPHGKNPVADAVCAGDGVEGNALFELLASLVDKSLAQLLIIGAAMTADEAIAEARLIGRVEGAAHTVLDRFQALR